MSFTTTERNLLRNLERELGVGFFISKSLIDAHSGRIWGKNNYPEGKGATINLAY